MAVVVVVAGAAVLTVLAVLVGTVAVAVVLLYLVLGVVELVSWFDLPAHHAVHRLGQLGVIIALRARSVPRG